MKSIMKKCFAVTLTFIILLSACDRAVTIPTPSAGSELIYSLTDGRSINDLVWSPTDQELAFTTFDPDNGKGQIYILSLSTHVVRTLVDLNYVRGPSWSADGQYIVYNSLREILIVPVDRSTAPKSLASGQVAAFSPNGKQIAIFDTTTPGTYNLKILDLETDVENVVFSTNVGKSSIFDLSWSPDNTELAFSFTPAEPADGDRERDIYVYNLINEDLSQLTSSGNNFFPKWSPNGKQIAYLHQPVDQAYTSIVISQVDSSCKIEVPDINHVSSLTWSPDGSYLAYSLNTGIYVLDLASVFGDDFKITGPKCS